MPLETPICRVGDQAESANVIALLPFDSFVQHGPCLPKWFPIAGGFHAYHELKTPRK